MTHCFSLAAFRILSLFLTFTTFIIICLELICWGPSVFPGPEYLFPSLGLVNFQPLFLKIHFLSPFLFFHLPKSLLYVGWHVFIAFVTILLLFYVLVF